MIVGYMCLVDWQHELGEAMGGTKIYASIEDLKKHRTCVEQCGIVEVVVNKVMIIQEQKLFGGK